MESSISHGGGGVMVIYWYSWTPSRQSGTDRHQRFMFWLYHSQKNV